jgi:hypothetical protein
MQLEYVTGMQQAFSWRSSQQQQQAAAATVTSVHRLQATHML